MIGRHIRQGHGKGSGHASTRKRMRKRKRNLIRKTSRIKGGGGGFHRVKDPSVMNALMYTPRP